MESAAGMQLRSKASPAVSIIQSATPRCAWRAVPSAVGRDASGATLRRQAGGQGRAQRSVQTSHEPKAGIDNILGSLELILLRQLHTSMIRYRDHD